MVQWGPEATIVPFPASRGPQQHPDIGTWAAGGGGRAQRVHLRRGFRSHSRGGGPPRVTPALRGHLLPPVWPKPEGQHPAQVIPVSVQSGKVGRGPTRSFQILPQDLLPEHCQRKAPPPEHRDLWAGRPSASRGVWGRPPREGGRSRGRPASSVCARASVSLPVSRACTDVLPFLPPSTD